MWTALGVIFLIFALGIPAVKAVGKFIFSVGSASSGQDETRKKIEEANQQIIEQGLLDKHRVMISSFRQMKLAEDPTSVVVGEEYEVKKEWVSGYGAVYPYTVTRRNFYFGSKYNSQRYFIYRKRVEEAEADHYTTDLYEYLTKIEFIDELGEEGWKFKNGSHNRYYAEERNRQCRIYCEAVSMLAHRYIFFGNNTEFRDAFIMALIRHREMLLAFVRECHAANEWKKAYNQVYDCDNYMQDFMEDYRVQNKVNVIANKQIQMPSDFRHFRPNTPDPIAGQHISHELRKQNRVGQAAQEELSSQQWYGVVFAMIFGGIILLVWGFNTVPDSALNWLFRFMFAGYLFTWGLVIVKALGHQDASSQVKKEDFAEKYYLNPFPQAANQEGKEYAKVVYTEIISHPLPYKYYMWKI